MLNSSPRQQSGPIQNFTYSQENILLYEADSSLFLPMFLLSLFTLYKTIYKGP